MLPARFVATLFSVGLTMLSACMVSAQNYPNKPIRLVTAGVGGGGDFASRQIAQGIAGPLGQPVFVDNRPSGMIPGQVVSQAPPDGYTLMVNGGSFWIGTLLQATPYDVVRDFAPITLISRAPNVLVVHPSVPAKSVKELIALAKAKPGQLNYSSSATGGASHLSGELLKYMTGINIVRIPYKNSSTEMGDLIGGYVQLTFGNGSTIAPPIKAGRLRALAVTTAEPTPLFPDVPTVASFLPGFETAQMSGIFAPAKTPEAIINQLNQEIVRFLKTAEAKERFFSSGVDAIGSTPEQLAITVKSEMTRMGKLIKDVGIKAD